MKYRLLEKNFINFTNDNKGRSSENGILFIRSSKTIILTNNADYF